MNQADIKALQLSRARKFQAHCRWWAWRMVTTSCEADFLCVIARMKANGLTFELKENKVAVYPINGQPDEWIDWS